MTHVLRVAYKGTIELQKQTLNLSDVYGIWLRMKLHLTAIISKNNYKTDLAKYLLGAIENRKNVVFKNPLMASALFLDPRFRSQIIGNETKKEEAIETLKNIWRRLIYLSNPIRNTTTTELNTSDKSVGSDASLEFNAHDALDQFLTDGNQMESNEHNNEIDIEQLLRLFDPAAISSGEDVLQFWQDFKHEHKELYELAVVVFAVPPTEVQLERDFSKLNFVFSNRRCSLTTERLDDIMIINLNADLFYEVKREDLENIQRCSLNVNN